MKNPENNETKRLGLFFLNCLIDRAVAAKASDIYIQPALIPMIRVRGEVLPLICEWIFTNSDIARVLQDILGSHQVISLTKKNVADALYISESGHRARINVSRQDGQFSLCIRLIATQIPTVEALNLPTVVKRIATLKRGLVLLGGRTGCGKSTTLAAIAKEIAENRGGCMVTVEDPIEFRIPKGIGLVIQNEVGRDVPDFPSALKGILRQNPDVVIIGELRDRESVRLALAAAETGPLVISTLHTMDAAETINRILSMFATEERAQVRRQLAGVLSTVVCQRLIPAAGEGGLIPAVEVLINNARVQDKIRDEEKTYQLNQVIEESFEETGMRTFDQSLLELFESKRIDRVTAVQHASEDSRFALSLEGIRAMGGKHFYSQAS